MSLPITISRISVLILPILFLGLTSKSFSKPESSIALYGKTQHHNGFSHYQHVNPKAPKGGKITFSVIGTFNSLNPFVIKGIPAAGLVPLYPHLFYVTLMDHSYNEPFSQYGYLAESIDVAEDLLSVVFKIRSGATFHDGSLITIDDVIFSFNTLIKQGSPLYKQYYGDIIKIEKVGKLSVKFSFKDATNKELPLLLGQFPIFSKTYYTKHKFQNASVKIPLGNGPYRISKVDTGHSITYERVKNWWGEKLSVNKGRYNFDKVHYIYFRDPEVAFEAFKSHDYDFRNENEIKKWVLGYDFNAAKKGDVKKIEIPFTKAGIMSGLFMNSRRDLFADKRVRRALTLAFDFEWLNKNYFYDKYERINSYFWGLDIASHGPISNAERMILDPFKDQLPKEIFTSTYTLPKTNATGHNRQALQQAKILLNESGWVIKNGTLIHSKTGKPFKFEILLPSTNETRLFNAYLKNLKRLGIHAKFRIADTSQYTSRVEDFDFDMIFTFIGQSVSPGNEQREYWGSQAAMAKGSRNHTGIKDPVIDQIIEKLIDAPDRETLVTTAKALDRVLLWGHYVVPLWGSTKMHMAYWNNLKNTGKFPKYNTDIFSWWDASISNTNHQK